MRKALVVFVAAVVLVASSVQADKPVVNFMPDIVLGDENAPDQTAEGYFIYDGLAIGTYITDEDTAPADLEAGFYVLDDAKNISIGGISRMSVDPQVLDWYFNGNIPDNKNILTDTPTDEIAIRAVTDLLTPLGPDVADTEWTSGSGITGGSAFVALYVADDNNETNTFTNGFYAMTDTDAASSEENGALTVDMTASDWATNGWASVAANLSGGATAPSVSADADAMYVDTTAVPGTDACIGAWYHNEFEYGPDWIDALVYVDWVLSCDASSENIVGVRSRVRPGYDGASRVPFLSLVQLLRDDPAFATNYIRQMSNDRQLEYKHYMYFGDFAEQLAHVGKLSLTMDVIDFPDTYATPDRVQAGVVTIDKVIVQLLPKPDSIADNTTEIFNEAGADLVAAGNWFGQSFALGDFANRGRIDMVTGADGVTLVSASQPSYTEERIIGIALIDTLGITLASTANQLIRATVNIAKDDDVDGLPLCDLRVRLYPTTFELGSNMLIPCYEPFGELGGTTTETFVIPATMTDGGTEYEVYNDTPPADAGVQWALAMDAINWYTTDPAYDPFTLGQYPQCAADFTLQSVVVDTISRQ